MKKFDSFWLGVVAGTILPPIFAYIFTKTFYHGDLPAWEAIWALRKTPAFVKLIIVALLPNLLGAFLAYSFQRWRMCRGFIVMVMIFLATALFFV